MKINNKKKKLLIFFTFSLISPVAFSSDGIALNDYRVDPSTWISGNLGISNIQNSNVLGKKLLPTLKISIGYDINQYIGIYSGYDYIGKVHKNDAINILLLGFKGNIPIFDSWNIFGKLGISYLNNHGDNYNISGTTGLGIEYKMTNSISTQVGYDYYQDMDESQSRVSLNQLYWGMTYRFGQSEFPIIKTNKTDIIHNVNYDVVTVLRKNYIVTFGTGKFSLDALDRITLDDVLVLMKKYPKLRANLIGRADKTGSDLINDKISINRALVVYQYLVANGIMPSRLKVKSLSNTLPIMNDNHKNSQLERSVQIIIN